MAWSPRPRALKGQGPGPGPLGPRPQDLGPRATFEGGFGIFLKSFWNHIWDMLVSFWNRRLNVLGSFFDYFEIILELLFEAPPCARRPFFTYSALVAFAFGS